jgi:hypothetical protein
MGTIPVWDQSRNKVNETPISINKSGVMGSNCNTSYMGGIDRIVVWGQSWAKVWYPIQK